MTVVKTGLELAGALPASVPLASELAVAVRIACVPAADLEGAVLLAFGADGAEVAATTVDAFAGDANPATVILPVPATPGTHAFTIRMPRFEQDIYVVDGCELPVVIDARAHATSVAVWGIEGPIEAGGSFEITAGAKCTDGCRLAGREITVLDAEGATIATRLLGEEPWQATAALFWCRIPLAAPAGAGRHRWMVRFGDPALVLPHRAAEHAFSFATVPAADHRLTVEVIDAATATPIAAAGIRIGPHRGVTDAEGRAAFGLAGAAYTLAMWKPGYAPASRQLVLDGDIHVRLETVAAPDEDSDDIWV